MSKIGEIVARLQAENDRLRAQVAAPSFAEINQRLKAMATDAERLTAIDEIMDKITPDGRLWPKVNV
jgi:hypothetical protein